MTRLELENLLLQEFPGAVSYSFFDPAFAVPPPFVCYYFDQSGDAYADNLNYFPISAYRVELYTEKDQQWEPAGRLEALFKDREITYAKTETWIDSERLVQVIFFIDLIGG